MKNPEKEGNSLLSRNNIGLVPLCLIHQISRLEKSLKDGGKVAAENSSSDDPDLQVASFLVKIIQLFTRLFQNDFALFFFQYQLRLNMNF